MTIKEKYSKYTNEELENGIRTLKEKIADDRKCMDEFKKENDVEMFRIAKDLYDRHIDLLMDAECAYNARVK